MAKKNRNNITNSVESKIYDNNNEEIIAKHVREVFTDYRDSFFNLIDDRLKGINYDDTETLEQVINRIGLIPPLWGKTGSFDPGNPDAPNVNQCEGFITSVQHNRLTKNDSELIINFNQSIADKKLIVTICTNHANIVSQNDLCAPTIKYQGTGTGSQTIRVGIRELSQETQEIWLEVFAFSVKTK